MNTPLQLQRAIEAELAAEPGLDHTRIQVTVHEAIANLTGEVSSYPESKAAEAAALRMAGICGVANELSVHLPLGAHRTDRELATLATRVLINTVHVPEGIRPVVDHGYVTLTGEAEWPYQNEAAERAVSHLTGVRGVHNEIRLRPRDTATNLTDYFLAALQASSVSDCTHIHTDAVDGTLVLTGDVPSCADRDEAVRIAWNTPGVAKVECRLHVAPAGARVAARV